MRRWRRIRSPGSWSMSMLIVMGCSSSSGSVIRQPRQTNDTRTLFGCADVAFVGDQLVVKSEDVSEVRRAETSGAARGLYLGWGKQGPSWPVPTTRRWCSAPPQAARRRGCWCRPCPAKPVRPW